MIIYVQKLGDTLFVSDLEFYKSGDGYVSVGRPHYAFEAKTALHNKETERMLETMQEGKAYKMVLRHWPI